jgi:hypothetical protein
VYRRLVDFIFSPVENEKYYQFGTGFFVHHRILSAV